MTATQLRSGAAVLVGAALALLGTGVLLYATWRPSGSAQWLPWTLQGPHAAPPAWAAISGNLPSFIHACAFSLFTAVLLPWRRRWAMVACVFWAAVNVALELGQLPALAGLVRSALDAGASAPLHALLIYLDRGHFDPLDMAAALAGSALAAAACLRWLRHRRAPTTTPRESSP